MGETFKSAMRVRPFSSGTEGYDWLSANCDRCTKKGEPDEYGDGPCVMETEVSKGFILGTIDATVAAEFGATMDEQAGYCTMPDQCSQFAPVMICESKATRTRRKCGKPATDTLVHHGLTRVVCARHLKAYHAAESTPSAVEGAASPNRKEGRDNG